MTYKQMEGACSEGENPRQDAETLIGSLFFREKILLSYGSEQTQNFKNIFEKENSYEKA